MAPSVHFSAVVMAVGQGPVNEYSGCGEGQPLHPHNFVA